MRNTQSQIEDCDPDIPPILEIACCHESPDRGLGMITDILDNLVNGNPEGIFGILGKTAEVPTDKIDNPALGIGNRLIEGMYRHCL